MIAQAANWCTAVLVTGAVTARFHLVHDGIRARAGVRDDGSCGRHRNGRISLYPPAEESAAPARADELYRSVFLRHVDRTCGLNSNY